jgi:hypothetical protein
MPKGPDSVGIKFDGPVMNGEKSPNRNREEDAIRARSGSVTAHNDLTRDPALRMHLRDPGKF